jgi:hypothetical protein
MFRVGQRVVCISQPVGGYGDEIDPVVGDIYTVRGIEIDRPSGDINPIGLLLGEIINAPRYYRDHDEPTECTFGAHRFRPLIERKTDISFAHEILRVASERVDA